MIDLQNIKSYRTERPSTRTCIGNAEELNEKEKKYPGFKHPYK